MIGAAHNKPNFAPAEHTRQNRSSERRKTGWIFPDPTERRVFYSSSRCKKASGASRLKYQLLCAAAQTRDTQRSTLLRRARGITPWTGILDIAVWK
jgi:hypothetical protein